MGSIRTTVNEGRPYISLEDLIHEIETVKTRFDEDPYDDSERVDFIDVLLKTIHEMENEFYTKTILRQ